MQNIEAIKFWDKESYQWERHSPFGSALGPVCSCIKSKTKPLLERLPEEGKILDIGSGADYTSYLGKSIIQKVISLDISLRMLMYNPSKRKAQSDVQDSLPIQSESIDLVTSFFLMRYLSKATHISLLKEIWRVLKDDGEFLLVDLPENNWEYQQSLFLPEELVSTAKDIGFCDVSANQDKLKYFLGYNTGFGWVGEYVPFSMGSITGRKISKQRPLISNDLLLLKKL